MEEPPPQHKPIEDTIDEETTFDDSNTDEETPIDDSNTEEPITETKLVHPRVSIKEKRSQFLQKALETDTETCQSLLRLIKSTESDFIRSINPLLRANLTKPELKHLWITIKSHKQKLDDFHKDTENATSKLRESLKNHKDFQKLYGNEKRGSMMGLELDSVRLRMQKDRMIEDLIKILEKKVALCDFTAKIAAGRVLKMVVEHSGGVQREFTVSEGQVEESSL